eukprot:1389567-Amorphochlora_amoeboformis.AAC.1
MPPIPGKQERVVGLYLCLPIQPFGGEILAVQHRRPHYGLTRTSLKPRGLWMILGGPLADDI